MDNKTTTTPWPTFFILFGAGILAACQVGKAPPVLTDIRSDLMISLFQSGWILSIFFFTGLLLGTCTGIIADTLGHRRLMLVGFALMITGCIAGSMSTSFPMLLCSRFLEGTGFLSVIISTPTLIFKMVQARDMKTALSVWSSYLPAGTALMMAVVPLLLKWTDWRGLWQINAGVLSVYVLILAAATRHGQPQNPAVAPFNIVSMFKDIVRTTTSPGPFLLATIFTGYAIQWLSVMGFFPTLTTEIFGLSQSLAAVLTAITVMVNIVGNLSAGWLLNRGIRRWKLIAIASSVQGLCAFVIYSDTPFYMVNFSGCLIFSIAGGFIPACVLGAVPIVAPSKRLVGTTNGLAIQGGQSGQVLGPPIFAWLVSLTGSWSSGSWFLAAAALFTVFLSLLLSRLRPESIDNK